MVLTFDLEIINNNSLPWYQVMYLSRNEIGSPCSYMRHQRTFFVCVLCIIMIRLTQKFAGNQWNNKLLSVINFSSPWVNALLKQFPDPGSLIVTREHILRWNVGEWVIHIEGLGCSGICAWINRLWQAAEFVLASGHERDWWLSTTGIIGLGSKLTDFDFDEGIHTTDM